MASRYGIWFYLNWQLTWSQVFIYVSDSEFHWFSNQALTKLTEHHQNHFVARGWLRDWRFIFLTLNCLNFVVCILRILVVQIIWYHVTSGFLGSFLETLWFAIEYCMILIQPQKRARRDWIIQFIVLDIVSGSTYP